METTQLKYSKDRPSPNGEIFRWITVKTNFIGFHRYKDAPENVAFLKNWHRHRFYVEAHIQIWDDDRELEFFTVQDELDRDIIPLICTTELGSCEQIAESIMWGLINTYGDYRNYSVEVSEDEENSARATWAPHKLPYWVLEKLRSKG